MESDIIEQLANSLQRELVEEIRHNEYFSVIVDETTADMSRAVHASFCIRHGNQELDIFDDFVGMYSLPKLDAATLTSIITDALCRLNLPKYAACEVNATTELAICRLCIQGSKLQRRISAKSYVRTLYKPFVKSCSPGRIGASS